MRAILLYVSTFFVLVGSSFTSAGSFSGASHFDLPVIEYIIVYILFLKFVDKVGDTRCQVLKRGLQFCKASVYLLALLLCRVVLA